MNKSQLRNIIREEIQNVISEIMKPSANLQKQFPEVVEYDRDRSMSNLNWTVISNENWNADRASDFQMMAGYHPAGYGGPYQFKEEKLPDGTFKYTWYCWASSD